jgi:hypothetical protein
MHDEGKENYIFVLPFRPSLHPSLIPATLVVGFVGRRDLER